MIGKGSRYENARLFTPGKDGAIEFDGIRSRRIGAAAGVLEHFVIEGDRLDLLAQYYYNDARRWWRILDANPEVLNGGDLALDAWIGSVILIPRFDDSGAAR